MSRADRWHRKADKSKANLFRNSLNCLGSIRLTCLLRGSAVRLFAPSRHRMLRAEPAVCPPMRCLQLGSKVHLLAVPT